MTLKTIPSILALFSLLFLLVFGLPSCASDEDDDSSTEPEPATDDDDATDGPTIDRPVLEVTNDHVTVTGDRRYGLFHIDIDGYRYVRGATSAIETGITGPVIQKQTVHVPNRALAGLLPVTIEDSVEGTKVTLRYPETKHGQITTTLTLMPEGGGLLAEMQFTSAGVSDLVSLIPVYVGPETRGGLFMKSEPAAVQVLQNGSALSFDFYADLQYADYAYSRGMLRQYLTNKPSSASNWNALLFDRANAESLHMGYLSFESVIPEVVVGFDSQKNPQWNGTEGWFTFQSRNGYLIARAEPPGSVRSSELFWMDLFTGRPHEALESYAALLADRLAIELTHEPMAGWDSWYVYSDKIDQQIILDNLAGIVETFGDYGMNTMQVDLGWENTWGDWTSDERFPDGVDFLAQQIRDEGLIPELWVSPTNAMRNSEVLGLHPDWGGRVHPLYKLLMQSFAVPLDLSREDVVDFVGGTGELFAGYGYESVKYDFAYYHIMLAELQDPSRTLVETYREALIAFRNGLGWDKFFINILLNGINYGLCDSMRISIDSWPCWGDTQGERCPESSNTSGYDGTGIRIGLKALARRYYLNNVVWVNHPDQIFFREHLGLIPHRSWATLVALSGAVMSLAEEIATMTAAEVETYRRMIPNLGITGVPWDLFDREYPEVWLTPLTDRNPGGFLLHLYSWGNNWDRTVNPPAEIPEETRRHSILLSDLELTGPYRAFEYWTQTDLGVVTSTVEIDVPARDSRVIVLRPVQDRPYLVSSNRHVSQGGVDLSAPSWNPAKRELSWNQELVLGFEHTVYVDPAGIAAQPTVTTTGSAGANVRVDGELWAVEITPTGTGSAKITLAF